MGLRGQSCPLQSHREKGEELGRPYDLALLAQLYQQCGEATEAFATLTEAFSVIERTEEHVYEAELYRIGGELLLNDERGMQHDERKTKAKKQAIVPIPHSSLLTHSSDEAEECFLKAIAIARQQQAKSWELRATISLARLWQQQGKSKQARRKLSTLYNWFTEGFETADLQEAKTLLEELA